ncbi:MAG: flagellar M-ring protein FliF [Sphingobium sp.]|uniref:flagellar basal-body MS-ring/collar protein FliF n=1 Tax=Sphingobium TaxID=165695 RepID=UPI000314D2C9|nr:MULTISPECIES: flagellar basal-body MS-ring/collar protein FliF [Sphingobium]MBU0868058.1 flagellar M-ring protein FliF [Alphaproteobacteria bacterium]MBA4753405.1 flagellar M-ring protein FliF [Sphingobium sp.]MBS88792.1 flagellar M-ring protein FliF [Sphingobium sp.]MBU1794724.1 flagellar M-ring protein FliF [Alphaproteobacteria bacterium]OUC55532.1 flagellar M-ring protein FliF [Sphingobium sp. GW456-12-10-14-TSB1]|tara:strand:- start:252 stop:1997 length:1746 start_codon:yes stop_codon:yes gene_type:complete
MSENALTIDGGAAARPALPATASSGFGSAKGVDALRARLTGFMKQPAVAKSLPLLGLLGVLAVAGLAWMALREPPQRDLFRGLPDGDKSAVAQVLDQNGIPYDFDNSGAMTVGEGDYFKAKMMLAAQGLPKSAPDGNSMIDSLPMGASRAVEGEKLRSAREMDLARTIEAIDSVESAKVHLAVEPPSVFLRDRAKPSASVMLRLANGRTLTDAQVSAIVHLVASSIPELSPDQISLVDQNGRLLSKNDSDSGDDRQLAIQSRIEDRYRQSVVALLTPILGANNFSTEVHAELNFAERQATRETYPQDEARLRTEQGTWASDPRGQGTGEASGIPGALSNQAPVNPTVTQTNPNGQAVQQGQTAAQTPGTPPNPLMKTEETFNRSFELGREVSVTKDAVGTVKRLSVAVALDNAPDGKARTPQEIAALEALVKGAIGFDQARGDVVALSSRSFLKTPEEQPLWYEADWVSPLIRNVSALLVALLVIFGIGRPLLKRRAAAQEAIAADTAQNGQRIGREISGELTRQAVEAPDPARPVTLDMISSTYDYAQRADLIRNFVKQDPDRAALVVRDLLKEGKKENA